MDESPLLNGCNYQVVRELGAGWAGAAGHRGRVRLADPAREVPYRDLALEQRNSFKYQCGSLCNTKNKGDFTRWKYGLCNKMFFP